MSVIITFKSLVIVIIINFVLGATTIFYTDSLEAPVSSIQHHSQDGHGHYSYGYTGPFFSKTESKSSDGITRGEFSYVDAEGKVQNASYVADDVHGFRITVSNLPVVPFLASMNTSTITGNQLSHLGAHEDSNVLLQAASLKDPEEILQATAIAEAKVSNSKVKESSAIAYAAVGPVYAYSVVVSQFPEKDRKDLASTNKIPLVLNDAKPLRNHATSQLFSVLTNGIVSGNIPKNVEMKAFSATGDVKNITAT